MKPNWVCSNCGMWSSRKFSVKRHITNQHSGNAFLVSYIDYLVGDNQDFILLRLSLSIIIERKKRSSEIFNDEFWKELARNAANGNRNS